MKKPAIYDMKIKSADAYKAMLVANDSVNKQARFEYKMFFSQPEGITLFYVDGAQSICHLYEPIKNSFYIIYGDFKTPYFKTKDDAQKFLNRIKSNEVAA